MGDSEWELLDSDDSNDNDNDILVVGSHGPGCNNGIADERTSFTGKIMYTNGESHGDAVSNAWHEKHAGILPNKITEEVYQIGPYPPNNIETLNPELDNFYNTHCLLVYHTAM